LPEKKGDRYIFKKVTGTFSHVNRLVAKQKKVTGTFSPFSHLHSLAVREKLGKKR